MANKKSNNNESVNVQNAQVTNQYNVVSYTTKKGGTACYIMGFKTEAAAKAIADKACKTVGNTWRYNDKGEKVYALSFGSRYCDIASQLCDALNKGDKTAADKAIAQTHEVYNAAVAAGMAERAAKKAEREAKKKGQGAGSKGQEKTYTQSELAEWLRKLNSDTAKEKAAAAKFFNELAKAA